MTDNFVSRKCCHCGTVAEYPLPSDFRTAIPKYLDGKPFEDENFSLKRTIMRCPKCGYVSFDVSRNILKDSRIVSTDDYEAIIKSEILPRYIADYIAIGYIYESQNEFYHASHAYLCAAWGCMDEKRSKEEEILLEKAAKLILKHIGSPEFKAHPDLNMLQCAVDILRRIREFDNAKKLAAYALSKNLPEDMKKNFLLEQSLCDNYIFAPHAIKPANETKISGFSDLFNRFAEAQTGDDKLKLQVFAEAVEYVNKVKFAEVAKGVSLVYNPFFNQGFDFIRAVNQARDALSDKKPTPAEKVPAQEKTPLQSVKVLTKAEDLKPQVSSEEKPVPMPEQISKEQTDSEDKFEEKKAFEEKPSGIKILTSKEDLNEEEEREKTPSLDDINEAEKPQDIADKFDAPVEEKALVEEPKELVEENSFDEELEENTFEGEPEKEQSEEAFEIEENESPKEEEVAECEEEVFAKMQEESEKDKPEISLKNDLFEEENVNDEEPSEGLPEEEPSVEETAEEDELLEEEIPTEETAEEEETLEEETEELPEEKTDENLEEEIPIEEEAEELPEEENAIEEETEEIPVEAADESLEEETLDEETSNEAPEEENLAETVEEQVEEPVEEEASEVEESPEKDLSEEEPFEPTYEEQCETITTLASIDGVISVSEVQALFEYGYVKARDLLEKMADDGVLTRTDKPETFAYVK